MINDVKYLSESDIRYMQAVFNNWIDKDKLIMSADAIEKICELYGLGVKVIEVSPGSDEIHFVLRLVGKTTYNALSKLRKEIAMGLAAPRGKVSIANTSNPILVELITYRFDTSGHQMPAEFNYACKPVGKLRKRLALGYLHLSRSYYQKAMAMHKQTAYLLRIKELRKHPFGWQPFEFGNV